MSGTPTVFDLDEDPLDVVDSLPKWIYEIICKSSTYQERWAAEDVQGGFTELPDDDGELPF